MYICSLWMLLFVQAETKSDKCAWLSEFTAKRVEWMVNGLAFQWCFSSLLIARSALQHLSHSHTDGRGCHARRQPAHQEQFGVQYLAQGHLDMQLGEAEIRTMRSSDYKMTWSTSWATALPLTRSVTRLKGQTVKGSNIDILLQCIVLDHLTTVDWKMVPQ